MEKYPLQYIEKKNRHNNSKSCVHTHTHTHTQILFFVLKGREQRELTHNANGGYLDDGATGHFYFPVCVFLPVFHRQQLLLT